MVSTAGIAAQAHTATAIKTGMPSRAANTAAATAPASQIKEADITANLDELFICRLEMPRILAGEEFKLSRLPIMP